MIKKTSHTGPRRTCAFGSLGWFVALGALCLCPSIVCLHAYQRYLAEVYTSQSAEASNRKSYSTARQNALLAVEADPRNGYALFHLGSNEFRLERYREAAQTLQRATPYMPHLPNLLRLIGQTFYLSRDYEACAQNLERYLLLDPLPASTPELIFEICANGFYRSQKAGNAAVALTRAEIYPQFRAPLLQTRIFNALLLNQITSADYAFRRFRSFYPQNPLNAAELFSDVLAADKLLPTVRFLEIQHWRDTLDPMLLKTLVLSYMRLERLDEARTLLKKLLLEHPNDPDLYLYLGDVAYQLKDMPAAREAYERHLKLQPRSSQRAEIEKKLQQGAH